MTSLPREQAAAKSFSRVREKFARLHTMPRVVLFLIIAGTATTYLAYRNFSRLNKFSDHDRQLYDDL